MKKTPNKTLVQLHVQVLVANEWDSSWHLLHNTIHTTLENEMQNTYKHLDKKNFNRTKQLQNTI